MSNLIDMTGQRFGRLTVIKREGTSIYGPALWRCKCDCGAVVWVTGTNLRRGSTKSCGCLSSELTGKRRISHGGTGTRLYRVWTSMLHRCHSPSDKFYDRYGGRGITVCDEWRRDFSNFREWAMANGYEENAPYMQCTIDRIDNDKGYSPDNCRWTDLKTQRNNRSDSRKDKKNERN